MILPLANRVDPFGNLFATPDRGTLMGNRGGRFHDPVLRTTGKRLQASKQWICCRLSFKGRERRVWETGYTELFFSDEVAALSAGHRPCFECRREDAIAFAEAWGRACATAPPRAPQMDRVLDQQRRNLRKDRPVLQADDLPDGTMIERNCEVYVLWGPSAYRWHFKGYDTVQPRPTGKVVVLTPPMIVACFRHGYTPAFMPIA